MKLEQSFSVAAPVEQVWALLVDVERIAPCLPGAEISGVDESGAYQGTFSVKLGPTTAAYRGSLRMEAVDEAARTATMSAKGTDKRGQGGASATIVSTMREEGGETHVDVLTDFHITGRLARFGRSGMIEDISRRLMRDFAECLQATLASEPAGATPVPSDDAGAAPAAAGWLGAPADATGAPVGTGAEPTTPTPPGPPAPPPVRAGEVPAEAAGGAAPSADPAEAGTLGVPPPSEPGRQAPGTTGGAAPGEPDAADAAVASAGGAAAEAATAGSAPPGADDLAAGPAAPAPPPDAGTTPPPPPGGPGGEVPTAGGAGGAPEPPPTGPPPPPGGRPRHADAPAEPELRPASPGEAPELGAPGTGPMEGIRSPGDPPSPPVGGPEARSPEAVEVGPSDTGAPPVPQPAPPEPAPRTGSVPPPGRPDSPAGGAAPAKAKPISGFSLFFSVLWERIKRLFGRGKD